MKITLSLLISLLIYSGCSIDRPEGKTEAEVLFKEAVKYKDEKRYLLSLEKLNLIKSQHPYSFYATHAELMQADIYYEQENYVESAAAYILFKDFHPKHEKIQYVLTRIGNSYFNQIPEDIDRDLSSAYEAIKYYSELVDKFPSSEFLEEAKGRIQDSKKKLEDKELYIADFYFKTKVFDAARYRYEFILRSIYRQDIVNHSVYQIVRSSYNLKEYERCIEDGSRFGSYYKDDDMSKLNDLVDKCRSKLQ
jgi:outer membrane protein assembly factor BamD